jgi:AbrB family looped-hinge helix DNA binding protein
MSTSTLTSKGQITIPKDIRDRLRLRVGHRLDFQIDSTGNLIVRPENRDVRELRGMLASGRRTVTVEEMNQAIRDRFRAK